MREYGCAGVCESVQVDTLMFLTAKAAQSIRLYCAGNLNALHSQMQMQMPLHNVALELHVQFSQHQCAAQCSAHERILIAYLNHN